MKDMALLMITLAAFAFGYFVMKKADDFMEENHRPAIAGKRDKGRRIRIAAETPEIFDSAASALEHCSHVAPHMEFGFSSGSARRLLKRVSNGSVDIALVSEKSAGKLKKGLTCVRVAQVRDPASAEAELEEGQQICAVWSKNIRSKDRDRVIFALENEHRWLKNGYCDYLG